MPERSDDTADARESVSGTRATFDLCRTRISVTVCLEMFSLAAEAIVF